MSTHIRFILEPTLLSLSSYDFSYSILRGIKLAGKLPLLALHKVYQTHSFKNIIRWYFDLFFISYFTKYRMREIRFLISNKKDPINCLSLSQVDNNCNTVSRYVSMPSYCFDRTLKNSGKSYQLKPLCVNIHQGIFICISPCPPPPPVWPSSLAEFVLLIL